ncbi:MAG: DUF2569 family protein [Proteobacteria bacterium]|nr:DUF2569 family protein [Pseudomonadota bacterium]MCL2309092.1 DUF2569 family protein [Pseudomonadota bacterium]
MFINFAFAQAAADVQQGNGSWAPLAALALVLAIFWVYLIRRQRKRAKEPHATLQQGEGETAAAEELKGLGGWLILVCLGLIGTILRLLYYLAVDFLPIFTNGSWEALTTPGAEHYHAAWAPLILSEVASNFVIIALAGCSLYLFFTKSRYFPKVFIGYMALNIIIVTADFLACKFLPVADAESSAETLPEVYRSLCAAMIWIPYMLYSRRVKNTFVR